jgi:SAP domain
MRTTINRQYSIAASRVGDAIEKAVSLWTRGVRQVTDRTYVRPKLPQIDLVAPVERYFDFVERTVETNRGRTVRWAKSATRLSDTVLQQAESAGDVVRDGAESVSVLVRGKAGTVEQTAREESARAAKVARQHAEQTQRADQERAREARLTERERSRQVHQRARQRYQGMTKSELSDLLNKRDLPKTGSHDELVDRLVKADAR